MRLYAKNFRLSDGMRVLDLDTQQYVLGIIWVDPDGGIAERYTTVDGHKVPTMDGDGSLAWVTELLRGRFQLVRTAPPPRYRDASTKIIMGTPKCARCPSVLTLRGDDLCVGCRAKERGKPIPVHDRVLPGMCKCSNCSRTATWAVVDEVEVTPVESRIAKPLRVLTGTMAPGRYLWDRGATVAVRHYCDRCFRPPRIVDSRGEPITDVEVAGRPTYSN